MKTYPLSESNIKNLVFLAFMEGVIQGQQDAKAKSEGKEMSDIRKKAAQFAKKQLTVIQNCFR